MGVPIYEQETTISYARDTAYAEVWTSDSTVMTKLDKLVETSEYYECIDVGRDLKGELVSKTYRITDKGMLSFRGSKVKREMTEEQKEAARERLKEAQRKKREAEKRRAAENAEG